MYARPLQPVGLHHGAASSCHNEQTSLCRIDSEDAPWCIPTGCRRFIAMYGGVYQVKCPPSRVRTHGPCVPCKSTTYLWPHEPYGPTRGWQQGMPKADSEDAPWCIPTGCRRFIAPSTEPFSLSARFITKRKY